MLQTLLRIGEWQSQGKSEWDRLVLKEPQLRVELGNLLLGMLALFLIKLFGIMLQS